jgi:chromosomal replication initiator protein
MWQRAEGIIEQAAQTCGLSVEDIVGEKKSRRLVIARHYAMNRVYYETNLSLPEIGRLFGRDHTTIIYGVDRWNTYWSKLQ